MAILKNFEKYSSSFVRNNKGFLTINKFGWVYISDKILSKYSLIEKNTLIVYFNKNNNQIALQFFENDDGMLKIRKKLKDMRQVLVSRD